MTSGWPGIHWIAGPASGDSAGGGRRCSFHRDKSVSDPVLYIPLLASQADILVDPSSSARALLGQWDVPQVASVAITESST